MWKFRFFAFLFYSCLIEMEKKRQKDRHQIVAEQRKHCFCYPMENRVRMFIPKHFHTYIQHTVSMCNVDHFNVCSYSISVVAFHYRSPSSSSSTQFAALVLFDFKCAACFAKCKKTIDAIAVETSDKKKRNRMIREPDTWERNQCAPKCIFNARSCSLFFALSRRDWTVWCFELFPFHSFVCTQTHTFTFRDWAKWESQREFRRAIRERTKSLELAWMYFSKSLLSSIQCDVSKCNWRHANNNAEKAYFPTSIDCASHLCARNRKKARQIAFIKFDLEIELIDLYWINVDVGYCCNATSRV